MAEPSFVPISAQHIPQIAAIHKSELPNVFLDSMGPSFLEKVYYPYILGLPKVIGICALEGGMVLGYVFFVKSETFMRDLILKNLGHFIKRVLLNLWNPELVAYLGVIFYLIFLRRPAPQEESYELHFIAVRGDYQGRGLGRQLVNKSFTALKDAGEKHCWLKTLSSTPQNVKFYHSLNFAIFEESTGRVYMAKEL